MGNKKRKFADDGWALWIDGDDRSTIYFNEWINPKGKSFVDVSVRIYGAKAVKSVNFFVPFSVEENEIVDLSYILANSDNLRVLFNTNGNVDTEISKYASLLRYDRKTLNLVNLSHEFMTVKKISYGTVITVDFEFIKESITADEAYLIFRLPHKSLDEVFSNTAGVKGVSKKFINLIQSPVILEEYGYSARINEARLLPPEINAIEVLHQQRIRKALVTISLDDEYSMNDSTCYRIRRLEAELNRNYAPDGYDCQNAIIYQWVAERAINMKAHYNFFFTMEHSKVSKLSMLIYLLLVVTISVFGCALYDTIVYLISLL